MRYDYMIIDTVNLAHKIYKEESPSMVSKKMIYKKFVHNFIKEVEYLVNKYLDSEGKVYLLFDNYFSRVDLQSSFMFADRKLIDEHYKQARKKESKEFYNSINLIRYYYLIESNKYSTCRVEGLEADDLVKPLFDLKGLWDKNVLMITNDLDWCRYLSLNIHWLPNLSGEPEDSNFLGNKFGFKINECNIIAFKSIFGDSSDNIPSLVSVNEENGRQFKELVNNITYPEDLINISRNRDYWEKFPFLSKINDNERQLIINFQLVSTIPCHTSYIERELIEGRDDKTLRKSLRIILELDAPLKFKFGGIKRPRA